VSSSWLISLITNYGLIIIFVLMVAENACLPVPSEVVVPYGGVLAALGHTHLWAVIAVSTAAALVGAGVVYVIGRYGGRPLALRYGQKIRIKPAHIQKAEEWFNRRGEAMVLYTRMLPVVRTFISLPAGIARMSWWKFLLFTGIGSLVWNTALAYLGWAFGSNWDTLQHQFARFTYIAIGVCVAIVVALAVYYGWKWRRHKARSAAEQD
jgi:membrane protein DedA with SNARE-associated domain